MSQYEDTICAPATAPGTGAIGIIRMSGPRALEICDKVVCFRSGNAVSSQGYRLKYAELKDGDELLDEGLVAVFRAPNSFTGEDGVELYLHSSPYIMSRALELLCSSGARLAEPGEFTRRAFTAGKMDLAQAEAVADVIGSSSRAEHKVAMCQLRGGYSLELRGLREKLLELSALLELELDFSEEEVEFADRTKLVETVSDALRRCRGLADSFKAGNALKNGVPVVIAGAPNSGKSTLLNALLGDDRAIVSDIPGTTRDTIEETVVIDGIRFRIIDTAGLRESTDEIERKGIERTLRSVENASIVILLRDGTATAPSIQDVPSGAKMFEVWNKSDSGLFHCPDGALRISARTGEGLDALRNLLAEEARAAGIGSSELLVTNARHAEALRLAAGALEEVRDSLSRGVPGDLVAESLRSALTHLGAITGEISSEDVLGEIFGRFCIGK